MGLSETGQTTPVAERHLGSGWISGVFALGPCIGGPGGRALLSLSGGQKGDILNSASVDGIETHARGMIENEGGPLAGP